MLIISFLYVHKNLFQGKDTHFFSLIYKNIFIHEFFGVFLLGLVQSGGERVKRGKKWIGFASIEVALNIVAGSSQDEGMRQHDLKRLICANLSIYLSEVCYATHQSNGKKTDDRTSILSHPYKPQKRERMYIWSGRPKAPKPLTQHCQKKLGTGHSASALDLIHWQGLGASSQRQLYRQGNTWLCSVFVQQYKRRFRVQIWGTNWRRSLLCSRTYLHLICRLLRTSPSPVDSHFWPLLIEPSLQLTP